MTQQPACLCWRPGDGGQCATCGEVQDHPPDGCGTYAGFQRHLRAGETPCDECRAARTMYVRAWRAKGGMVRTRAYNNARGRALARLAGLHREEYRALYTEELANAEHRRPKGEP